MTVRKWFVLTLAVFVSSVFFQAAGGFSRFVQAAEQGGGQARYVQVYYFHGKVRCYSCNRIEQLTVETIRGYFQKELESGRLKLSVVNVSDPENSHFVNDYQLYSQSVILSDRQEGREVKWKNLIRVWELLKDDAKFKEYVRAEVEAFLAAS